MPKRESKERYRHNARSRVGSPPIHVHNLVRKSGEQLLNDIVVGIPEFSLEGAQEAAATSNKYRRAERGYRAVRSSLADLVRKNHGK